MFRSYSPDDLGRHGRSAPRSRLRLRLATGCLTVLDKHALELVDGNQLSAPRHLDRLDQPENATVEGRAADAERRGCLGAGVGEPLDSRRFSRDYGRRRGPIGIRVSLRLLASASLTPTGHPYSVHK